MAKIGISKKKSIEINGILNAEEKGIEINGETLSLEGLIKDFDGYDIKIVLSNESFNENPTSEDVEERDLSEF